MKEQMNLQISRKIPFKNNSYGQTINNNVNAKIIIMNKKNKNKSLDFKNFLKLFLINH